VDLRKQSIECRINLCEHLPPIFGNRVQLQQVMLNLVMSAIEAMSGMEPRGLSFQLATAAEGAKRTSREKKRLDEAPIYSRAGGD